MQIEYFLTDALGSVRQLTNAAGQVTLVKSYEPYGSVVSSVGSGVSVFGYTGKQQDVYAGLVYLWARYYSPGDGRFLSRDTWSGAANRPMSLNRWNYVEGNPINFKDSSGNISEREASTAATAVKLLGIYGIILRPDWGYSMRYLDNHLAILGLGESIICGGDWREGDWSLGELLNTVIGVQTLALEMGHPERFKNKLGTPIIIYQAPTQYIAVAESSHSIRFN